MNEPVTDLNGKAMDASHPVQFSSFLCSFWGKIGQIIGWYPSKKSWIRLCDLHNVLLSSNCKLDYFKDSKSENKNLAVVS